jgi:hypothetical protein
MNCFVIMPFSREFDDVYAAIKSGVEGALSSRSGRCFRLDEARPAGRITDRLLAELRTASICVADLTGCKPNVMWEIGFAMALGKPVILVTQQRSELPFDLHDMQSLEYDRTHLSGSLTRPLQRMVVDTVAAGHTSRDSPATANPHDEVISELRSQVSELKSIVSQAVRFWSPRESSQAPITDVQRTGLEAFEGAWLNKESGSHMYASVIGGDLIVPYCYAGNDRLVGVYYGWKRIGEHWFARFTWLDQDRDIAGFAFLKQESIDMLKGAWWYDDEEMRSPQAPPDTDGVAATLEKRYDLARPVWATDFLNEVRKEGLERRLSRHSNGERQVR